MLFVAKITGKEKKIGRSMTGKGGRFVYKVGNVEFILLTPGFALASLPGGQFSSSLRSVRLSVNLPMLASYYSYLILSLGSIVVLEVTPNVGTSSIGIECILKYLELVMLEQSRKVWWSGVPDQCCK